MQTTKPRPGSLDNKSSLPAPKIARRLKTSVTESDPKTKTIPKNQTSKLVSDRNSPRIPLNEIQKKRIGKIPELESQVSQLQQELKKVKEELNKSEALRKEAQEEAKETKQQLIEINETEDSRIEELRKLSQERDKTWQSELEAMQRQHGMDSAALSCAINEVQKVKTKLFETESELDKSKFEVKSLQKLVKQLEEGRENIRDSSMDSYRQEIIQLKSAVEVAEKRYQEEYIQSTLQIREAYEQSEEVTSRFIKTEAELAQEIKRSKAEIESLRKELMDKKKEDENGEAMEAELKRVKIQCEQWRKAAETAASILNNDEERTESTENVNMLKKFGVLLKKNHK